MNITFLDVRDLDEAWWRCIRECLLTGRDYIIDKGSYAGQYRREFDFMVCQIRHPSSKCLVPSTPDGIPPPTSREYIENEYLPYLMANIERKKNEQYTYGEYIEPQFLEICKIYKEYGYNNNQMTMTIGDKDSISLEHPPCLKIVDTRVIDGKLNYVVYFRSWDLWGGFPVNLGAIQIMKEQMAQDIGVEDGELIALSKGLHLYDHQWEVGKAVARL